MSVEKCRASASRAWLLYFFAAFISARERVTSTTMDVITTAKLQNPTLTSVCPPSSRSTASHIIQPHVIKSRAASARADRFSIFPCPKLWSWSAGLPDIFTHTQVIAAATKSSAECSASDNIPKLPVANPTTALKVVSSTAAQSDRNAVRDFSISGWSILKKYFSIIVFLENFNKQKSDFICGLAQISGYLKK